MIPIWKIKRELETLRQQVDAIVERLLGPGRQRRQDRRFPGNIEVHAGLAQLTSKVAIVLVYQPHGLSESIFVTCRHLQGHGYSVLLVANSALTDADLNRLQQLVWRVAVRENFGYDFGGYRDGIRLLRHWAIVPDMLVMLNDSIWFPIFSAETMLVRMEQSFAEFIGALRHVNAPAQDAEHAGIFLSYFFLFKRSLLTLPVFVDYWDRYVATSNKYLTVRRGERGFSSALFGAGVRSSGMYSRDLFLQALTSQSNAFLMKTLHYGAYTDDDLQQQRDQLLCQQVADQTWREQVLQHIRVTVNKRNFHSSFCYASIALLGIPLLKKNRGELQSRMRRQYVRAVRAGDLPRPEDAIFDEIVASVEAERTI
ncbi:rhamnan synthesis F family protein [Hydrogenophaga sp.]|uniref:rhamnan synthesis F family protein n=1 Tax=Hydrogenophaga sp. TaxID=1904254 RepID=UPI0019B883EE|nr:rhamnan synthesis F family protein [Hydrogenophaga sp.]MBD3892471.1 hypothetical protein [Hydrogenophaga sp.]